MLKVKLALIDQRAQQGVNTPSSAVDQCRQILKLVRPWLPEKTRRPRVLVETRGGCITAVYCNRAADVMVRDWDNADDVQEDNRPEFAGLNADEFRVY